MLIGVRSLVVLLTAIAAISGCDGRPAPSGPNVTGGLALRIPVPLSSTAHPPTANPAAKIVVTGARLRISGQGMTPIDSLLFVNGGVIEARVLGIPVGERLVDLALEGPTAQLLWRGESTVQIEAGEVAKVTLVLRRVDDTAPDFLSAQVTPQVGLVDSVFRLEVALTDVHDRTDSLWVRWDLDDDGLFEVDWTTDKVAEVVVTSPGGFNANVEARDRSGMINATVVTFRAFALVAIAGKGAGRDTLFSEATSDSVVLRGGLSSGRPEGELIYHWSQLQGAGVAGTPVIASNPDNHSVRGSELSFSRSVGRGTYAFLLQVEDLETGAISAADTLIAIIPNTAPRAVLLAAPDEVEVGGNARLRGSGTDADADVLQYRWRGERVDLLSDSTSSAPTFTPDTFGEFSYVFVVIDEVAAQSTPIEVSITVPRPAPMAAFEIEPTNGKAPLTVTLTNTSDYGDTYLWSFGTGDRIEEESPLPYTYEESGVYSITLWVFGATPDIVDSTSHSVTVSDRDRPDLQVRGLQAQDEEGVVVALIDEGQAIAFRIAVSNAGSLASQGFSLLVFLDEGDSPFYALEAQDLDPQRSVTYTTNPWQATRGEHLLRIFVEPAASTVPELNATNDSLVVDFVVNGIPIAIAGADEEVLVGTSIVLDGSASDDPDDDDLTYAWSQVAGPTSQLTETGSVTPRFRPLQAGTFTLILVVDDGQAVSEPDTVIVRATEINLTPVAEAGSDQEIEVGFSAQLNGSDSNDPEDEELTYSWRQESGPLVALSDPTVARPIFLVEEAGTYVFELIVNDGEADSEPDRVTITGRVFNEAPIARVAGSQTVEIGAVVQLDGSASSDPDNDELTFEWTAPAGIALDDSTIAQPQFTATKADVYTFTLTVADGVFRSAAVVVVITVTEAGPGPATPTANAGLDQVVSVGATVLMDGTGSTDPDGDEVVYFWTQTAGREVELTAAVDGTATFVAPDSGLYVICLVVSDGLTSSSPDEVRIIAVLQNARPIADAGPDQTVTLGDTVQLDGSGSVDPFLGEIFSYLWEAPEGIVLLQADAVIASFVASVAGEIRITLVVSDGSLDSVPDEVVITVEPPELVDPADEASGGSDG